MDSKQLIQDLATLAKERAKLSLNASLWDWQKKLINLETLSITKLDFETVTFTVKCDNIVCGFSDHYQIPLDALWDDTVIAKQREKANHDWNVRLEQDAEEKRRENKQWWLDEMNKGNFKPSNWNWCISHHDKKWFVYVMGNGSEQKLTRWATDSEEQAISDIMDDFGIAQWFYI